MGFWEAFRARWRDATPSAEEFGAFFGGATWFVCAMACGFGAIVVVLVGGVAFFDWWIG